MVLICISLMALHLSLSIFSYVSGPSVCLPWRCICSGPLPIFNWIICLVWSHVISSSILEIKPLSEVSLANIYSHIVGSLFILLMVSLAVKKLFILMKSHLFILSFISLTLGGVSVKILMHGISEIFLPMFSSTTFMVSRLIFKSFIHLEFIFVYDVKSVIEFHFFAYSCPDLPTSFVEEAIFTPFYVLPRLSNIN